MAKQEIKDIKSRKISGILNADDKNLIVEVEGVENSLFDLVKDFNGYDIKIELTKEGGIDE